MCDSFLYIEEIFTVSVVESRLVKFFESNNYVDNSKTAKLFRVSCYFISFREEFSIFIVDPAEEQEVTLKDSASLVLTPSLQFPNTFPESFGARCICFWVNVHAHRSGI